MKAGIFQAPIAQAGILPKSRSKIAGPVGFEPTILGSEGPRLGPGSTTGPENQPTIQPYYRLGLRAEEILR